MKIAGSHRYLAYASWLLSAVSALLALVPYYYIWQVMREVLQIAPDFSKAQQLTYNGWMAVLFAVISVLVYIAALMCSHISAFRVATNLRLQTMSHIVKLPSGSFETFGSGRVRKIVNESSGATETYLAHQLPDRYNAIATPCGLLALLFIFDWRMGLLSIAPVLLAFMIMMSMAGRKMQEKTRTLWKICPTRPLNMSAVFPLSRPSARPFFPSENSRIPSTDTVSGSLLTHSS